jgi:hypothetical protein
MKEGLVNPGIGKLEEKKSTYLIELEVRLQAVGGIYISNKEVNS